MLGFCEQTLPRVRSLRQCEPRASGNIVKLQLQTPTTGPARVAADGEQRRLRNLLERHRLISICEGKGNSVLIPDFNFHLDPETVRRKQLRLKTSLKRLFAIKTHSRLITIIKVITEAN